MKIIFVLFAVFIAQSAFAQPFYLGLQLEQTNPLAPTAFKDNADVGKGAGLLLGYRMTDKWALELGYDQYDFSKIKMTHSALIVSGVYRPWTAFINPYARFGLGAGENKYDTAGIDKQSGLAGHVGGGVEFNFVPATLFAGLSWNYLDKLDQDNKNAQSFNIQLGVIFPGTGEKEVKHSEHKQEASQAVAETAPTPVPAAKPPQDFINKCLNSNAPECISEGSASVKVDVEFLPGKAVVPKKYEGEIERLAKFLNKYPKTTISDRRPHRQFWCC